MMKRTQVQSVIVITLTFILFTGCAASQNGSIPNRSEEINELSFTDSADKNEDVSQVELTENSTLPDYLAYAALHNPELEAAFNRWKTALEKIPQVSSLQDPRFTYAYYIENVETRVGPQRHRLELSQTFPWFGKLDLQSDIAYEEAQIQKQAYENLILGLFYKIKTVYYDYYLLSRSLRITEENMKLLSYIESVSRTQYESGKASNADVIKAQVELGRLEERFLSLQDMREPVMARLNGLLNRPANARLPWPSILPVYEIAITEVEILQQARESNPDLKTIDLKVGKEEKSIDLAKKQFYPDIMFGLSYIETGDSSMPGTAESGKDPVMAMFSINLPLWREKYHARVREAELRQKTVVKERENRENMLITELKTALYNFRDAQRKSALYKDTLIPKAQQSLNVTQTAFAAGNKDFLSLLDTQRTLLELELAYEGALVNGAKFQAQIELLAGRDLEDQ